MAPIDYSASNGSTLEIAVARRLATDPDRRIGSLLLNPGGPGGSGIDFLRAFVNSAPTELQARFDLVSWDPRGVGESQGLRCNDEIADDLNYEVNTLDGIRDDLDRYVADNAELGAACLAQRPELLDHVGTVASARDIELLRLALHEDKLSYLGFSYGSRLGTVYASLFPTHVRAMVLDGAFPPSLTSTEVALNAGDLEAALVRIDRTCDLEAACAVASPGLIEAFTELRRELDATPGTAPLGLSDRSALLGATFLAIYLPRAWDDYAAALGRATAGDLTRLRTMASAWFGDGSGSFSDVYAGSNTAIMCADGAHAQTVTQAEIDAEATLQASPLLGEILFGANCAGWPGEVEPLPPTATAGAPPILVVGGTHDPATPLRWAERLAAELDRAALVTFDGDGHTSFGNGNTCVDEVVMAYLIDVSVPAQDVVCQAESGVLGVRLSTVEGGIRVDEVFADSAAFEAGLIGGDIITSIDGQLAADITQTTTSAGQTVELEVSRGGDKVVIIVTASRRPWTLPPGPGA